MRFSISTQVYTPPVEPIHPVVFSVTGVVQKLIDCYTGQITNKSCSVATLCMLINTIRTDGKKIKQLELLASMKPLAPWWVERVTTSTKDGHIGVTLEELCNLTTATLAAFKLTDHAAQVVVPSEKSLPEFIKDLELIPQYHGYIMLYFKQSVAVGKDCGVWPHVSLIGGICPETKHVLVMDVDRTNFEPYYVPVETLLNACTGTVEGFGPCGYIRITNTI